ncbi:unnamed protein product [Cylindrotheca closterium]|uniref:Transcriptional regulator ycf27 n=1 Tax=Cylindrotheca closterium TaxID=2856 RepID=A0AAD2JPD3_9STRA|nr:unnamed protein product [Cylindrotheca closterium]
MCPSIISSISHHSPVSPLRMSTKEDTTKAKNAINATVVEETVYNDKLDQVEPEEELNRKFIQRNKRWVVLVDDEEPIRLAVGDFLYSHGYQVTACADADSMLEVCAKPTVDGALITPDAIVSDIRMPGKDGLELLGLIREDQRLTRIPVILLTAKAMTKDRIDGYKAGADVYLPKPFDPEELLSILDNIITRRKQMSGKNGDLMDLKTDMENIKFIMQQNSQTVVKKTDVFLTDTERDVLELVCKGYTNTEVATKREVAVDSVNRMLTKLYSETGTRTRTELVRWAMKHGYVSTKYKA